MLYFKQLHNNAKTLFLVLFLCPHFFTHAQVGINPDGSEPDASAMLDVKSTDKGMLVPRMDSMARNVISNPATGLLVYDTDTESFWYYDEQWNEIAQRIVTDGLSLGTECSPRPEILTASIFDNPLPAPANVLFLSIANQVFTHSGSEGFLYSVEAFIGGASGPIGRVSAPQPLENGTLRIIAGNDPSGTVIHTQTVSLLDVDAWNEVIIDAFVPLVQGNDYIIQFEEVGSQFSWQKNTDNDDFYYRAYAYDCLDPFIIEPTTDRQTVSLSNIDTIRFSNGIIFNGIPTILADSDEDTKIEVEKSPDQDVIRFSQADIGEFITIENGHIGYDFGLGNIYFGRNAGQFHQTANDLDGNVGIGIQALNGNTSGSFNTAIGSYALSDLDTGDNNVVVGRMPNTANINSGDISKMNNSVLLGAQIRGINRNKTYNNIVAIGANTFIAQDSSVVLGNAADVGIGTNTPDEKLHVIGKIKMEDGNAQAGYVLTSDADGVGTWQVNVTDTDDQTLAFDGENLSIVDGNSVDISSVNSIQSILEDADGDTKIQVEESADEDVIRFDLANTEILRLSKNSNGITLVELPSSGANSTLYGQDAGVNISTGQSNTFIGKTAGKNTTIGQNNTFVGRSAGTNNQTGLDNTFIGRSAGFNNQTGSDNVAIGSGALLFSKDSTTRNVAIGKEAGFNMKGDGNVFLGDRAGRGRNGDNRLFIENSDSANPLIYGEFDNDLVRINGDLEVTGNFPNTDDQTLSFDGANLSIADGNSVDISSVDTDTDDQTLSFDGVNLSIVDGNSVDISGVDTDTDDQTLSFDGVNLSIADGNSVDISSINSTQSLIEAANGSTKIQVEESTSENIIRFDLAGTELLVMEKRGNHLLIGNPKPPVVSLFFGKDAGRSILSTGLNNTFIGNSAGKATTSGSSNTFLGLDAGLGNSTGNSNVFLGIGAGLSNNTGNSNLYVGTFAGQFNNGSNNVFIGNNAGSAQTNDNNKLFIDNSDTSAPLIYGEFDNNLVRINGDLEVTGSSNLVPVGTIIMWIGDENETVPDGWLICDNRLYNTTTYPDLFALLGSDRTPNFLGRFPVGAPRDGINGATGISVGGKGGEEDKTLIDRNLPPHSHDIKFREGEEGGNGNDYSDIGGGDQVTGSTESQGEALPFKIMPPFLGVQFLIKAE
ncbi:MAG: tail fiber protein [Bacteroidota bacterium]